MNPIDAWVEPIRREAARVQAETEAIRAENEQLRARLKMLIAARFARLLVEAEKE